MSKARFNLPKDDSAPSRHHELAAALNWDVVKRASATLTDSLSGANDVERILLKAAAGAGKSHALKGLVVDANGDDNCRRIAVTAFQNRQIWPIAESLGKSLGREKVCLFSSQGKVHDVPASVIANAEVVSSSASIPDDCKVVVATSHRLGAIGERTRLLKRFGPANNGEAPFDVLFVDEAWQLPHHLFDKITNFAPVTVGVGDVGQLPPLEVGNNPWSGDPGYNPYRAWPTAFADDENTWAAELPAVWRPTSQQLGLWRAFYPEWQELDCVAAPGDRSVSLGELPEPAAAVWGEVAKGSPVLVQVEGLPEAEAPDVDLPLISFVEDLLDALFRSGFSLNSVTYEDNGRPKKEIESRSPGEKDVDPLVVVLASRNQAVDDATDAAARLRLKHALTETDIVASTVDSWQGQTNGITVAIHPLSGAAQLDSFNSAFGRLAVTCTRATHGLLVVSRPGIEDFLNEAPAQPGTPFGEPGTRHLPRQTHQRILDTFSRATIEANEG